MNPILLHFGVLCQYLSLLLIIHYVTENEVYVSILRQLLALKFHHMPRTRKQHIVNKINGRPPKKATFPFQPRAYTCRNQRRLPRLEHSLLVLMILN